MTEPMPAHGADAHNLPDPQDQEEVRFEGEVECEVTVTLTRSFDFYDECTGPDTDDATDDACERTSFLARTYVNAALLEYFTARTRKNWAVGDIEVSSRAVKD